MDGQLKPYLPELTIKDYNTYLWYTRGVRCQLYKTYGSYSCTLLRDNAVLLALFSDSLAGRTATCRTMRLPGTLVRRPVMCETQGIRQAAQIEILMSWHYLRDRSPEELTARERLVRAANSLFLRRAYRRAIEENPAMERLVEQERAQATAQDSLVTTKDYSIAAEPMSNVYGALYASVSGDDMAQCKIMRYIGSCIGRIFFLLGMAKSFARDKAAGGYNVFIANGITSPEAAEENARRQALAAANDLVRVYSMLDIKLNRSLLDNIMLLGLHHAVDPMDQENAPMRWELP